MSLLDIAESNRRGGMDGMQNLAGMEANRNSANQQLSDQRSSRMVSNAGAAIGTGFAIGGPVGAAVGAGMMLLGSLF